MKSRDLYLTESSSGVVEIFSGVSGGVVNKEQ